MEQNDKKYPLTTLLIKVIAIYFAHYRTSIKWRSCRF